MSWLTRARTTRLGKIAAGLRPVDPVPGQLPLPDPAEELTRLTEDLGLYDEPVTARAKAAARWVER